jgi:hypothetical protein
MLLLQATTGAAKSDSTSSSIEDTCDLRGMERQLSLKLHSAEVRLGQTLRQYQQTRTVLQVTAVSVIASVSV